MEIWQPQISQKNTENSKLETQNPFTQKTTKKIKIIKMFSPEKPFFPSHLKNDLINDKIYGKFFHTLF
jgi:hypothetical protein